MILLLLAVGCASIKNAPDLGGLYSPLAQHEDPYRNPIIVIPGIMGSRLVDRNSGTVVWGAFGSSEVDPNTPDGARAIALPMATGKPLRELTDGVESDGALDRLILRVGGYPIELSAYAHILGVLGVGGYRDETLGESGVIDWGDRHFTCFQFDYDWRRDIVETAQSLERFIQDKRRYVQREIEARFGIENYDVKFDIVAHSMGGLVARYYLRFGASDLPADGRLPSVTWEGGRYVENLVMIGTPGAGSLDALWSLVNGHRPALLFPKYAAVTLGTMPSVYEMLPRSRHQPLVDPNGRPVPDIFAAELWQKNGWGLADPDQDRMLQYFMPEIEDPHQRRRIALEHQHKALERARQFSAAMDASAVRPGHLRYFLIAGDAEPTPKTARFDHRHRLKIIEYASGDGVVLRSSALLDERTAENRFGRLISPIEWSQVLFLFTDHLELTRDPVFTDNMLYFLLEAP
jgi:pimeloyl-ACP methyl ester carboxylesterase